MEENKAESRHHLSRYKILKSRVNKYTLFGLIVSVVSIIIATSFVSWQLTGEISLTGFILAHKTNPALWFLDLTPFMFAYWGQRFFYDLISQADNIIIDSTSKLHAYSQSLITKLKKSSLIDKTTGLPNQEHLFEYLQNIDAKINKGTPVLLIVLSLTNIKQDHDVQPSLEISRLLRSYAQHLVEILESPSVQAISNDKPFAARLDSNDFAIVIPSYTPITSNEQVLNKLVSLLLYNKKKEGMTIKYVPTLGASIYPDISQRATSIVNHGFIAITQANNNQKSYALYNPNSPEAYKAQPLILEEMKKAIQNENIEIFFQPTFGFENLSIIGAEALVRISNTNFGIIDASQFISMLEGTPLILKYSDYVLRVAIAQLSKAHLSGHKIFITINLTRDDIQNSDFIDTVSELIEQYNIDPQYIHLDISEKACLSDFPRTLKTLTALNKMGLVLTIDDFCSGHSSFVYLNHLPIKEIKIDKSFVMNMEEDENKMKMVESIIAIAKIFKIDVSAEGIETRRIMLKLKSMGCQYGKGYYFSEAVPSPIFEKMLFKCNTRFDKQRK